MIDNKTRLNAALRDAIVQNALINSGVVAEEKSIIDGRAALHALITNMELERHGLTQRSLRDAYDKALKMSNAFMRIGVDADSACPGCYKCVSVNMGGRRVYLYANGAAQGGVKTHITEKTHPELRDVDEGGNFFPRKEVIVTAPAVIAEFDSLVSRAEKVKGKREEVTAAVRGIVKKVTTVGKLLELWPEAKYLLPADFVEEKGTGVALAVDTLNALCGLPK